MNRKLVIVMDSGRLRAFRVENDGVGSPRFTQLEDRQTNAESHLSDLVSDQTGQFSRGAKMTDGVSASGERHNLELEIRRRAIKSLAKTAEAIAQREDPEEIYFAAASEINQRAFSAMGREVRERIRRNVPANLTHLPPPEIVARLCKPAPRASVAAGR